MFLVQGEDGCDEMTKFLSDYWVRRILVENLPNGYCGDLNGCYRRTKRGGKKIG